MTAEGSRISGVSRVKGHKEDTVSAWIRDAAEHTEDIEDILMSEFRISRGQIEGLRSYVGNKGGKKRISRNGKERSVFPVDNDRHGQPPAGRAGLR